MNVLIDYICEEIKEMEQKVRREGKLSMSEIEYLDKLEHIKKDMLTSEAMMNGGYSNEGGYSGRRNQTTGRYYDGESSNEGSYYSRAEGSMDGGYSGRRYSRDEGKNYMAKQLEQLMNQASGQEREIMQQALSKLNNM